MIRSMTGFGAAEGAVGTLRVSVEVRTVNHRFFSPNIKLPSALSRWESDVREALRQRVARGHVTLSARVEQDETARALAAVDEARFGAYVVQLRATSCPRPRPRRRRGARRSWWRSWTGRCAR